MTKFFSIALCGLVWTTAFATDGKDIIEVHINTAELQEDIAQAQAALDAIKPTAIEVLQGSRATVAGLVETAIGSYIVSSAINQPGEVDFYTVMWGTAGAILLANGLYDTTTGIIKLIKVAKH